MSEHCKEIHEIFNSIEKHDFSFNEGRIPENGIYILFESGEKAHGHLDRIVRIGAHTGQNQLRSRLKQHFIDENKDRSIFRKNIGRAILNASNDEYLPIWELDLTTRENKEKYSRIVNKEKQNAIEKEISKILQQNFTFCVVQIKDKALRLSLESKIISTVSSCKECAPSNSWLGNYSTKDKIKESGLWLVNGLHKEPLSDSDIEIIKKMCSSKEWP